MYYTYTLYSLRSNTLYIGSSDNLKRRLKEHNDGIGGAYTKKNRPYALVHYEAFLAKADAQKQELFYKTGYGREVLKEKIESSLNELKRRG